MLFSKVTDFGHGNIVRIHLNFVFMYSRYQTKHVNSPNVDWNPLTSKGTHRKSRKVKRSSTRKKRYKFTVNVARREHHMIFYDVL